MFEYIKEYYKVPAEIGREILFNGKRKGVIVSDMGNYIGVNFYDSKPEDIVPLHPVWRVEYLGFGSIRKVKKSRMRSKERYREYIEADWFGGTFADWLGIKTKN